MRLIPAFIPAFLPAFLPALALLALSTIASAADELGVWQFGSGTIASKPAVVGELIAPDAAVASGGHLMLSPNSIVRLTEEADGHLMVHLDQGVLQANIGDKGPYQDLHVLGSTLDIRVTGTLFVVERVKADTDYIALVEGRVQVNLRKDVAVALNQEGQAVDLSARQGLGGSVGGGFAPVDTLTGRPQLPVTAMRSGTVRNSATTTTGGWSEDRAMGMTDGMPTDDVSRNVIDEVRSSIIEQVSQQVIVDVSQQVTDTIIREVIGGGGFAQPLAGPPGPPR